MSHKRKKCPVNMGEELTRIVLELNILYGLLTDPPQVSSPVVALSPSSLPNGKKMEGSELSVRLSQRSHHSSSSSSSSGRYVSFTADVIIIAKHLAGTWQLPAVLLTRKRLLTVCAYNV